MMMMRHTLGRSQKRRALILRLVFYTYHGNVIPNVGPHPILFIRKEATIKVQLRPGNQAIRCLWQGGERGQRLGGEQHEGVELLSAVRAAR